MTRLRKYGVTYVDWAISFGLFVLTVMLILVLVRPKVETTYDKEDLLFLVQTAFTEQTNWNVQRVPVFIHKLQPASPHTTLISIDYNQAAQVLYTLPPQYELASSPLTIRCTRPSTQECSDIAFFLYVSPKAGSDITPDLKLTCIPADPAVCDADLGATENFYGLNNDAIDGFRALSYSDQKTALNLPENADVAIVLAAGGAEDQLTRNDSPPLQTNVYARTLKTWLLDEKAQTTPAEVRIKVWR